MKYFLSSYKLGDSPENYLDLLSKNKTVAYVPSATDFSVADAARVEANKKDDIRGLEELGLRVVVLDLKQYFESDPSELRAQVDAVAGLWVSGGNVFILRQAMKLSGLDQIIKEKTQDADFVYGGYSAGCCVLSESLKSYQFASDATDLPYAGCQSPVWDGLGLIDFAFMPHFQSDHSESDLIDKEIEYCKAKGVTYRPVKDGDAIVL